MTLEIFDCEQGSADWHACRLGIPTASRFSEVMALGGDERGLPQTVIDSMVRSGCSAEQLAAAIKAAKSRSAGGTRRKYLRELASEVVRGTVEEDGYTNSHMERGKTQEDDARRLYAFMTDAEPARVGFIRDGRKGCSPDSLIGADGGLEIKSALGHIQVERLQRGTLPPEHKAQVQGSLWITGRTWWDFVSFSPGLPPLIVRVARDEAFIADLAKAVDAFNDELDLLVGSLRGAAQFRKAAA